MIWPLGPKTLKYESLEPQGESTSILTLYLDPLGKTGAAYVGSSSGRGRSVGIGLSRLAKGQTQCCRWVNGQRATSPLPFSSKLVGLRPWWIYDRRCGSSTTESIHRVYSSEFQGPSAGYAILLPVADGSSSAPGRPWRQHAVIWLLEVLFHGFLMVAHPEGPDT